MQAAEFSFQPLEEKHLTMLREWLLRPQVARWWGPAETVGELRSHFLLDRSLPDATLADIAFDGQHAIGFVQCYVVMGWCGGWWEEETDPAPQNARAIRCYLGAGFRPVGEVVTPDGLALLMRCSRLC